MDFYVISLFCEHVNQIFAQNTNLLIGVEERVRLFHADVRMLDSWFRDREVSKEDKTSTKFVIFNITKLMNDAEDTIDKVVISKIKVQMSSGVSKLRHRTDHYAVLHEASIKLEHIKNEVESNVQKVKYFLRLSPRKKKFETEIGKLIGTDKIYKGKRKAREFATPFEISENYGGDSSIIQYDIDESEEMHSMIWLKNNNEGQGSSKSGGPDWEMFYQLVMRDLKSHVLILKNLLGEKEVLEKATLNSYIFDLEMINCFLESSNEPENKNEVRNTFLIQIMELIFKEKTVVNSLFENIKKQSTGLVKIKYLHQYQCAAMLNQAFRKINRFRNEIEGIIDNYTKYMGRLEGEIAEIRRPLLDQSHMDDINTVGLDNEASKLVKQLTSGNSQLDLISIVGMEGIGKTTLAWKIYNDQSIKNNFDVSAWVDVSREISSDQYLLECIAKCIMPGNNQELLRMPEDKLTKTLYEQLQQQRYLIVMDDLYSVEAWDYVKRVIPDNMNGSRILVTTRHQQVASYVSKGPVYFMHPLSDADSWKLLSDLAFRGSECPSTLEEIGSQIARNCNGVPLAIVIVGNLLAGEETWARYSWVYNNTPKCVIEGSERTFMTSTFNYLPRELRLCFLYFGMFPEHYEISAKQLIQLWIAEGFVHETDSVDIENVGESYLEELINLGLVQVVARRTDDGVKTCCVLGLLREFCIWQGDEIYNFFKTTFNREHMFWRQTRRLAISETVPENFSDYLDHISSTVRSFQLYGTRSFLSTMQQHLIIRKLKMLMVLNLGSLVVLQLPHALWELHNLRYLRINAPKLQHIPFSICGLFYLQTLDMRESCIHQLPGGVWKMQWLRHLHFKELRIKPGPGSRNSTLCPLKSLSGLYADRAARRFMVKAKFGNVKKIGFNGPSREVTSEFLRSLDHLNHLQTLKVVSPVDLPDSIVFPLTLTKVTLRETELQSVDIQTLEKLPNLVILKLQQHSVTGQHLCFNGGFPMLRVLHMVKLDARYCRVGSGAMCRLQCLFIKGCTDLTMSSDDLGRLTSLKNLEVVTPSTDLRNMLSQLEPSDRFTVLLTDSIHH